MTTTTAAEVQTGRGRVAPREARSALTLEGLASQGVDALTALYMKGEPPRLVDLDGAPRGRMLTWVGPLGHERALRIVRRMARSSAFPWGGKSFTSRNETQGRGINRVRFVGNAFPFETRFGPSALDGRPTMVLDYDLPENPRLIRQIHDELRQVAEGLYLGPAMWKARPSPKLVLFFAIATDRTR